MNYCKGRVDHYDEIMDHCNGKVGASLPLDYGPLL